MQSKDSYSNNRITEAELAELTRLIVLLDELSYSRHCSYAKYSKECDNVGRKLRDAAPRLIATARLVNEQAAMIDRLKAIIAGYEYEALCDKLIADGFMGEGDR